MSNNDASLTISVNYLILFDITDLCIFRIQPIRRPVGQVGAHCARTVHFVSACHDKQAETPEG
jgi:hypothetical protein